MMYNSVFSKANAVHTLQFFQVILKEPQGNERKTSFAAWGATGFDFDVNSLCHMGIYRLNNFMSFTNSTNHYFQAYLLLLKSFLIANTNSLNYFFDLR